MTTTTTYVYYPNSLKLSSQEIDNWARIFPDFAESSPRRQQERVAARIALVMALQENGEQVENGDVDKLIIDAHHYVQSFPHFLVSLAHDKSISAGLIVDKNFCYSVGIDIEPLSREIKESTFKFWQHPWDMKAINEKEITLWARKEAAYKALSSLYFAGEESSLLALKRIWVKEEVFGIDQQKEALGYFTLKSLRYIKNKEHHIVCCAFIPELKSHFLVNF